MKTEQEIWQEAYDNYCLDNFGGGRPEGHLHDEAAEAADEAVAEWTAAEWEASPNGKLAREQVTDRIKQPRKEPPAIVGNTIEALSSLLDEAEAALEKARQFVDDSFGDHMSSVDRVTAQELAVALDATLAKLKGQSDDR